MVGALKAAKAWGVPPLHALVGRSGPWSLDDTILATALVEYEKTRVDELGFPKRISEDPRNKGRFMVRNGPVNHAIAAMDEWEKRQNDNKRKAEPGVRPTIRYMPPSD